MQNPVETYKALADETRYALVQLLLRHDYCVGSLSRKLGVTESAVSQHLKVLREVGLVASDKRGYFTHYSVDRTLLESLGQSLVAMSKTPREEPQCSFIGQPYHTCHQRREE